MYKNNIQIKNIAKKIAYVVSFSFLIIIGISICLMCLGTNTNGEVCSYITWKQGDIYQWVWNGKPCAFTMEYSFSYLLLFMMYLVFDYIHRLIIGFNPSVFLRIKEIALWTIVNWAYLIWLTISEYDTLSWIMIKASFLGTVMFMLPLVGLAIVSKFLNRKNILVIVTIMFVIMIVTFTASLS